MHHARIGILVIDDQQLARQRIVEAAALMPRATRVHTAATAQEGMAVLLEHGERIDMVLLDMRMTYKGILLIPHIHRHAPNARILPYTVDASAAEQMEELGCLARVPKVLPLRHIATLLDQAMESPAPSIQSPAFYRYIANDAADSALLAPPVASGGLRVAILGDSAVEVHGLRALVERTGDYLATTIVVATRDPFAITAPLMGYSKSVIIGTLAQVDHLIRFHTVYSLPVLLYTRLEADLPVLPATCSILFETAHADTIASALTTIAQGDVYDPGAPLRTLPTRSRLVLKYLAQQCKPPEIAERLDITPSRVYHILSELYRVPGLPDTIDDLRAWARQNI